MCICDAYYTYHSCPNHTDFRNDTAFSYGMVSYVLRDYTACIGTCCLVLLIKFSIFQMGKLTQSQKALFLWRSPLAKLQ